MIIKLSVLVLVLAAILMTEAASRQYRPFHRRGLGRVQTNTAVAHDESSEEEDLEAFSEVTTEAPVILNEHPLVRRQRRQVFRFTALPVTSHQEQQETQQKLQINVPELQTEIKVFQPEVQEPETEVIGVEIWRELGDENSEVETTESGPISEKPHVVQDQIEAPGLGTSADSDGLRLRMQTRLATLRRRIAFLREKLGIVETNEIARGLPESLAESNRIRELREKLGALEEDNQIPETGLESPTEMLEKIKKLHAKQTLAGY